MASDEEWSHYTDETFDGKVTGNAEFARECRATPLEAKAILDLVWNNIGYFDDSYYGPLTRPIAMRVGEFHASIGR